MTKCISCYEDFTPANGCCEACSGKYVPLLELLEDLSDLDMAARCPAHVVSLACADARKVIRELMNPELKEECRVCCELFTDDQLDTEDMCCNCRRRHDELSDHTIS